MNTYLPADQNFRDRADAGFTLLFTVEPGYVEGPWPLEGQAEYVARPKSTEDVSALVELCHTHRVAIIPYGGGTGLVGGQLAETGAVPLILSLEKMTKIRAVFPEENVMIVDAGVILADPTGAEDVDRCSRCHWPRAQRAHWRVSCHEWGLNSWATAIHVICVWAQRSWSRRN